MYVRSKYLVITLDYLFPIFICLGVIVLGYLVLYSSFFKINTIVCTLDYAECLDPSVLAELEKLKGQNIFTLSEGRVTTRLTSGDFTIREANIKKELPGKIFLDLHSVYPVVALQIPGDPTWVILDQNNRVIGTRANDPNVPTVIVPGPLTLSVGKRLSDDLLIQSIQLAKNLADELFTIKSITLINDDAINLTLSDGRTAIFTPKKDLSQQLRSLQLILRDATMIEGIWIIDVRFIRPVLR